ncbi:Myc-type, basic helix-loop-helix domain-containing protein [Tanacetum coccineum]
MAALSFYSNWSTFPQNRYETVVPQPPDLSPFQDNLALFESNNNHFFTNNLFPCQNTIKYPTLSSAYNPISHQHYSNPLVVPNVFDHQEFFPMDQMEKECYLNTLVDSNALFDNEMFSPTEGMQPEYYSCNSYHSYPFVSDVCDQMQPELPPFPEIYQFGGGSSDVMPMLYDIDHECNVVQGESTLQVKDNGNGRRKLSAQSMAARVRRRKISEKTLELGKLVPGGHRMTTAEMFQAAFKYIKFLQAQVNVLQHMDSSPVLGEELQAFVTNPSIQEKLYTVGKCIVTEKLGKTLTGDYQGTNN